MGVFHRDLKPENFLLLSKDEDSPLKATDFGLSVFFKPGEDSKIQYMYELAIIERSYGFGSIWFMKNASVPFHHCLCLKSLLLVKAALV